MIKHRFAILIWILAIILILSLFAGFNISNKISHAAITDYIWDNKNKAEYHIMVILDGSNQLYGDAFKKGLVEASKSYKIATEIIKVDGNNYQTKVLDVLEMATYAKVDGIIVHGYNSVEVIEKIQEAVDAGIPVITLNEDLPTSNRICYVGANRYSIGQMAGDAIATAMNEEGKIAVIEQEGYHQESSDTNDMLILGLKDVIKAYPKVSLEVVKYTQYGVLSAETIATQLLRDNPDINGIFCTDGQNTLGVLQVIVDNNRVGDFSLIGYGDDAELLDYIQKGKIINSTIIANNEDIGREAIKAFYEYKHTGFVSSYINTSVQLIDQNNVNEYLMVGEGDE